MFKTLKEFMSLFGLLGDAVNQWVSTMHPYLMDNDENQNVVVASATTAKYFASKVTYEPPFSSGLCRISTDVIRSRHGDGECSFALAASKLKPRG